MVKMRIHEKQNTSKMSDPAITSCYKIVLDQHSRLGVAICYQSPGEGTAGLVGECVRLWVVLGVQLHKIA